MGLEDHALEQRITSLRVGAIILVLGALLVALSSISGMRAAHRASDAAPSANVVALLPESPFCGIGNANSC